MSSFLYSGPDSLRKILQKSPRPYPLIPGLIPVVDPLRKEGQKISQALVMRDDHKHLRRRVQCLHFVESALRIVRGHIYCRIQLVERRDAVVLSCLSARVNRVEDTASADRR